MKSKTELLDWAETLLCNAECPKHCEPEEWDSYITQWRNAKHRREHWRHFTAWVRSFFRIGRLPKL